MLTVILSIVPYLIMNIISLFIETQQLLGDLSRSWLSCLGSLVFLLQETFMKSLKIPKGYLALCVPDEDLFLCVPDEDLFLCVPDEDLFVCVPDEDLFVCVPDEDLFLCVPDEDFVFLRT